MYRVAWEIHGVYGFATITTKYYSECWSDVKVMRSGGLNAFVETFCDDDGGIWFKAMEY